MSIYGDAFALAPRATQSTLVSLLNSWADFATALGTLVPDTARLREGQDSASATAALAAWDALARSSGNAPMIETIVGRSSPTVAPGWPAIARRASEAQSGLGTVIERLRDAYTDAENDALLRRMGASSFAGQIWIDERVRRISRPPQPPPTSTAIPWPLIVIGGLILYGLSKDDGQ